MAEFFPTLHEYLRNLIAAANQVKAALRAAVARSLGWRGHAARGHAHV